MINCSPYVYKGLVYSGATFTNPYVYQNATYTLTYRWWTNPIVYKAVTAAPALSPLTLTVTGHGLTDGWPVGINDLAPPLNTINSPDWPPYNYELVPATVIDANTLAFNSIDAALLGNYTSGGTIGYYTPVDLSAVTGVFNIYTYPGVTPLVPFLTVAATIAGTTITISLSPAQTLTLVNTQYTYTLVVTDGGGNVTILDQGILYVKVPGATPC